MEQESPPIYDAAIYVRLSKDDADLSHNVSKNVSDSITNQKAFIMEFLKDKPDIRISAVFVDDGYSGSDFNRPGFMNMLEQIYAGRINCVIVKDLSRLGRNYIETGRYVERVFPAFGVRFLSVNDSFDSIKRTNADYLLIPFHNLVNDSYLRDTSLKIRSHLEVKRKQGDFTGNFVSYGYKKREDNHNKIEIDTIAASVVKEIFNRKIMGMSQQKIADYLNDHGILSPMEYKRSNGIKINTNFKIYSKAKWSPVAVGRVLTNPIYIGVLEQGKTTTQTYKIKKRIARSKEEWICIKGNHPPIISEDIFYAVARIMENDTRTAPRREYLHTFSGLVKCGLCDENMIRKITNAKGKQYAYYICASGKHDKICSNTGISEKKLEKVVRNAINKLLRTVIGTESIDDLLQLEAAEGRMDSIRERIQEADDERNRMQYMANRLKESYQKGMIDQEEYKLLLDNYNNKIEKIKSATNQQEKLLNQIKSGTDNRSEFVKNFVTTGTIGELKRFIVVLLINKIIIYDKETVEICFNVKDEMRRCVLNGKT